MQQESEVYRGAVLIPYMGRVTVRGGRGGMANKSEP